MLFGSDASQSRSAGRPAGCCDARPASLPPSLPPCSPGSLPPFQSASLPPCIPASLPPCLHLAFSLPVACLRLAHIRYIGRPGPCWSGSSLCCMSRFNDWAHSCIHGSCSGLQQTQVNVAPSQIPKMWYKERVLRIWKLRVSSLIWLAARPMWQNAPSVEVLGPLRGSQQGGIWTFCGWALPPEGIPVSAHTKNPQTENDRPQSSGRFPTDLGVPPLEVRSLLESNPLCKTGTLSPYYY